MGAFGAPEPDFNNAWAFRDLPDSAISAEQIISILSAGSVGPPHGLELLKSIPSPQLPQFPARPAVPLPMSRL